MDVFVDNCLEQENKSGTIAVSSNTVAITFANTYGSTPKVGAIDCDDEITFSSITTTGCNVDAPDTNGRTFNLLIHCQ